MGELCWAIRRGWLIGGGHFPNRYECEVLGYAEELGEHEVRYIEDGVEESIDLDQHKWRAGAGAAGAGPSGEAPAGVGEEAAGEEMDVS